jgi:hypothetical protein
VKKVAGAQALLTVGEKYTPIQFTTTFPPQVKKILSRNTAGSCIVLLLLNFSSKEI